MKCKCRNNSRFPQFTVGKTYTFQYEDKYKTRVVVLSDENEELRTDLGNFLFSFDPMPEPYKRTYKRQYPSSGDSLNKTSSTISLVMIWQMSDIYAPRLRFRGIFCLITSRNYDKRRTKGRKNRPKNGHFWAFFRSKLRNFNNLKR